MKKTIINTVICSSVTAAVCALLTMLNGWTLSGFCYCMILAGLALCVAGVGFTPANRISFGGGQFERGREKLIYDSWQMEGKKRQNNSIDFLYTGGALCVVLGFLTEAVF
ncbi:MAG: hypothetical protein E7190_10435 [Erysipelotrichaceae bacterium]|nr:hypothetical protein [Erysipelotrichaceae bacterium]